MTKYYSRGLSNQRLWMKMKDIPFIYVTHNTPMSWKRYDGFIDGLMPITRREAKRRFPKATI